MVGEAPASKHSALSEPGVFFVIYVLLALPTYVLPYFGSNSALVNGASAAMGLGGLPQFWLHLTFLAALGVIAWVRGGLIGRSWLCVFPALAAIFDLMPGFNWVPLLPTFCHVAALVTGVSRKTELVDDPSLQSRRLQIGGALVGLLAVMCLYKFVTYSGAVDQRNREIFSNSFAGTTTYAPPAVADNSIAPMSSTPQQQQSQVREPPAQIVAQPQATSECESTHKEINLSDAGEWSDWTDVKPGCMAFVDPAPSVGAWDNQCRWKGEITAVCKVYDAIRFKVKNKDLGSQGQTIWVWTENIKKN